MVSDGGDFPEAEDDLVNLNAAYLEDAVPGHTVEEMTAAVYERIRSFARKLSPGPDSTMNATALANEAFLRLWKQRVVWESETHFRCIAGRVVRRVLTDYYRQKAQVKRGGGWRPVDLDPDDVADSGSEELRFDIARALDKIGREPRNELRVKIATDRFFGGLKVHEIAKQSGLNERTIRREWNLVRALLAVELGEPKGRQGSA